MRMEEKMSIRVGKEKGEELNSVGRRNMRRSIISLHHGFCASQLLCLCLSMLFVFSFSPVSFFSSSALSPVPLSRRTEESRNETLMELPKFELPRNERKIIFSKIGRQFPRKEKSFFLNVKEDKFAYIIFLI